MIKTTISEFKENYPNLILRFEKEWGMHAIWGNRLTGNFIYWLQQKKNNKSTPCDICNKIFKNRRAMLSHRRHHNKEFNEKISKATIKQWQDPKFRKRMSGKNHPMYGRDRSGEKCPAWKYDKVGYLAIHIRAHKADPKPKNGICAYCHKVKDKFGKTKLIHSNKDHSYKLPINPDEWWWIHKSCHDKYDKENHLRHKDHL